ncbi:MAG: hypothetical protein DWC01_01260 [Candidatus Poseidoniales archaeon]|nr:MAG: hypothetical protein DWC01_01260 [Candidatus Poseidoniales archaeon]
MSDDNVSVDSSETSSDGTVPFYSNWFIILGAWGLLLAVLNMFSMAHPTQHISWGGLLTFEATNAAFGEARDGFHFEVLGDTVFMVLCVALLYFGFKPINDSGNTSSWFSGLVVNDTWTALGDMNVGGGQRTMAAWCLLLGFVFYFWFGIKHDGWIDVGVYSVSIALIATGFALNHASRVPPGDENID